MALTRATILTNAMAILDGHGMGDLTMRRLSASLGIQPGALYWHFVNKQALLEALADEILAGVDTNPPVGDWDQRVNEIAHRLRGALLTHRDGAMVVAAAHAHRAGRGGTTELMTAVLADAGFTALEAELAAVTLLHYVFGHVADEQLPAHDDLADAVAEQDSPLLGETARFGFGLSVFVDGLRARLA